MQPNGLRHTDHGKVSSDKGSSSLPDQRVHSAHGCNHCTTGVGEGVLARMEPGQLLPRTAQGGHTLSHQLSKVDQPELAIKACR